MLSAAVLLILLGISAVSAYDVSIIAEHSSSVPPASSIDRNGISSRIGSTLNSFARRKLRSGGGAKPAGANFCASQDVSYKHRVDNPAGDAVFQVTLCAFGALC